MTDGASRNEPMTEQQIIDATVGERRRHDGPVRLDPPDPRWPAKFESEAARIRSALGDEIRLLEHVGSTSVPGLVAKPIIDIVLAVADSADEATYVPQLEAAGYVLGIREPDWWEHRMFKDPEATVHLHVFTEGVAEIDRMIRFRDHLRSHEADRELYASTKHELAAKEWRYVQNYADAKSAVVEEILLRARTF